MDDTANGAEALRPGMRWNEEEERMMLHPHLVEEDMEVASDIRSAKEVAKMGSSISNMISLTWDCPSNNGNNRMALLNTEVWVENNIVWYEHYNLTHGEEKDVDGQIVFNAELTKVAIAGARA